ncbi:aldehyde dehydrogenase family protein [Breznakiella homolactica]|uniref:Aldehyde dehydrogenase family protein n=1 Tax=Breznakiella homolactica TaxID=2798577 RepID=A0A7T7XQI1_9SPIR|nr:aldehyde dehydrogenase family protein [Breznakiella homolactica]QQO10599.1 aldehyde dehydrogenase family protein [Breznakiella homolactica]
MSNNTEKEMAPPAVSSADVAARISAGREAQREWGRLSVSRRAKILKPVAAYLADHGEELSDLISRENGKVKLDALATELLPAAMAMAYYIKQAPRVFRSRTIRGGSIFMFNKKSRMEYRPYGVVGIISPWNYPFSIPFSEIVMALLAGNGVVLKVASDTLGIGRALDKIFSSLGLPAGLFSYVEIPGKEAGPAFISGGVDKLFFTGSTAVGRELMALAAPRLLPLVLELGGADAAVIREDADLGRAAAGILWAGFSNAGQSCGGVQRVLVHRAVYEPFLAKLSVLVGALRIGSSMDSDMGPMTTLRQKEAVRGQIKTCLDMGARIAAQSPGADLGDDSLFAPAMILTNVTDEMPIMMDEIFGPVVGVIPVEDDREALRIANASSYGLTGSVWSRDRRRAKEIAREMNAGAIMVNDHLMSHGLAETPWGGFGDSGLGRTHGAMGLMEMVKPKVVVDEILPGIKKNIWWQPYSEKVYRGLGAILTAVAGSSIGRRIGALPGVMKIFFRYWEK